MGTVWIMGWLFAVGMAQADHEFKEEPWGWTFVVCLCLLIVWPAFIGYVVVRVAETLNPKNKDSSHGES